MHERIRDGAGAGPDRVQVRGFIALRRSGVGAEPRPTCVGVRAKVHHSVGPHAQTVRDQLQPSSCNQSADMVMDRMVTHCIIEP